MDLYGSLPEIQALDPEGPIVEEGYGDGMYFRRYEDGSLKATYNQAEQAISLAHELTHIYLRSEGGGGNIILSEYLAALVGHTVGDHIVRHYTDRQVLSSDAARELEAWLEHPENFYRSLVRQYSSSRWENIDADVEELDEQEEELDKLLALGPDHPEFIKEAKKRFERRIKTWRGGLREEVRILYRARLISREQRRHAMDFIKERYAQSEAQGEENRWESVAWYEGLERTRERLEVDKMLENRIFSRDWTYHLRRLMREDDPSDS